MPGLGDSTDHRRQEEGGERYMAEFGSSSSNESESVVGASTVRKAAHIFETDFATLLKLGSMTRKPSVQPVLPSQAPQNNQVYEPTSGSPTG